jgi:hypothetical protein
MYYFPIDFLFIVLLFQVVQAEFDKANTIKQVSVLIEKDVVFVLKEIFSRRYLLMLKHVEEKCIMLPL